MRRSRSSPTIRQLLERIYERSAPVFARLRAGLRVQNNRVVPPGRRRRRCALWESAVTRKGDARRSLPSATARAERRQARLSLRRDRTSSTRRDARSRSGYGCRTRRAPSLRFKALALGVGAYRESHMRTLPLGRAPLRPDDDAVARRGRRRRHAAAAGVARVLDAGVRRQPTCPTIRRASCAASRTIRSTRRGWSRRSGRSTCVSAPNVSIRSPSRSGYSAAPAPPRAPMCSSRPARVVRYRMLMWTLERVGIRAASVYAAAARQAARIGALRRPPRLRTAGAVSGRARASSREWRGSRRSTPPRRRR